MFLLRIHHAPNTMIATRKTTSATGRPGRFFLGGCGGCAVAGGAVARLLPVAGRLVVCSFLPPGFTVRAAGSNSAGAFPRGPCRVQTTSRL